MSYNLCRDRLNYPYIMLYPLFFFYTLHCSSLHGSLSSSRLSLAEIGVENEGEAKEDAEGTLVKKYSESPL